MNMGLYATHLLTAGLLAMSSSVHAAPVTPPNFSMAVTTSGVLTSLNGSALALTTVDNSSFSTAGSQTLPGMWRYDWTLTVKPDPVISGMLSITNMTAATQNFDISLNLPVTTAFSPALQSGSLGLTLTDMNNDGLAQLDSQTWTGRIDNASAMTLFTTDPLMCFGLGGSGCSATIAPISSGPSIYASGISNTMGINLLFNLSAGDKVSFTTNYTVAPVPVPAAVWMFVSALIPLTASMRKRAITAY